MRFVLLILTALMLCTDIASATSNERGNNSTPREVNVGSVSNGVFLACWKVASFDFMAKARFSDAVEGALARFQKRECFQFTGSAQLEQFAGVLKRADGSHGCLLKMRSYETVLEKKEIFFYILEPISNPLFSTRCWSGGE